MRSLVHTRIFDDQRNLPDEIDLTGVNSDFSISSESSDGETNSDEISDSEEIESEEFDESQISDSSESEAKFSPVRPNEREIEEESSRIEEKSKSSEPSMEDEIFEVRTKNKKSLQ